MKKSQDFLFILLIFRLLFIPSFCSDSLSVAKSMIDVIREFYIGNNLRFDFIIYGKLTNHLNEVITEVIKEISQEIVVNIQHFGNGKYEIDLKQSAVIFTETIEKLHELQKYSYHLKKAKNSLGFVNKHFKFLIYVEHMKNLVQITRKVEHIIYPPLWLFEFYLINTFNYVELHAVTLYSKDSCGKLSPKFLNAYSKVSQKWEKKLKDFDHFSNFHVCMLSIAVDFGPNWYLNVNRSENKKYFKKVDVYKAEIAHENFKYSGLIHEVMKSVAKKANFTLHYTAKSSKGELISGANNFQSEFGFTIHINFNSFEKDFENSKRFWYSEPCGSIDYYFLVMLNDLYTNYEKLLMPFDFITWILLILTVGLTFGIIFGYYAFPKCIRMIFYSSDMKDPAFNTLGVIFGISQLKLPQRSTKRFVLSLFIWFCLIFRTCYQSMLFEFMTSDMRKPLPASIDDLREMNYTVMILDLPTNHFHRMYRKILDNRQSPKFSLEVRPKFMEYYEKALNKTLTTKYAFFVSNYFHAAMNETAKNSLSIMDNERITELMGFSLFGNNILQVHLNDIISQLIPSGIIQHLNEFGVWYFFRRLFIEDEDSRRILSMTDLEFGFVIWIISLSLPITCFIIEILNGNYEKLRKKAKGIKLYTIGRTIETLLKLLIEKYQNKFQITLISSLKLHESLDRTKLSAKAICDVIRQFYIANNIRFDFIIYGRATNYIKDVINEVAIEISEDIPVNITHIKNIKNWNHELYQSAIILTETMENVYAFHHYFASSGKKYISWIPKKFKFLFYIEGIQSNYIKSYKIKIHDNFQFDIMNSEFILIQREDCIDLYVNLFYSKNVCAEYSYESLNYYIFKTQKWKRQLKNFDHSRDFFGCLLSFHAFHGYSAQWYTKNLKEYFDNSENFTKEIATIDLEIEGLTHEIIQLSAKKFNFLIHYTIEEPNSRQISGQNNFKMYFFLTKLQSAEIDDNSTRYYWSQPYMSIDYYFLVTENDFYTNYEKLFMPFDETTWILLSITILLTFIITFGSHYCPQWIRIIIFGLGIKDSAYRALGMMFGISQIKLPQKTVNRFALALFIWFWLIFRTCYQSMLFNFMTSDMRKPLPDHQLIIIN
ncbi:hypothetical protein PVAND_017411 [Polypedilum vanderplanki]|uniref:Ionotropic receptor n=1 Tax=Polypedilum vanderplanki TaxID=319348 RepID=A0A9J6BI75_POLVA|nr:hypothetical protein PVAND_017411 [Polypedilum vanderplanki]